MGRFWAVVSLSSRSAGDPERRKGDLSRRPGPLVPAGRTLLWCMWRERLDMLRSRQLRLLPVKTNKDDCRPCDLFFSDGCRQVSERGDDRALGGQRTVL